MLCEHWLRWLGHVHRMEDLPRTSCAVNWPWDTTQRVAQCCASRMSANATWSWRTSPKQLGTGSPQLLTLASCHLGGHQKGRGEEEPTAERQTTMEETEAIEADPDLLSAIRFSLPVAETVRLELDCWATSDAVLNKTEQTRQGVTTVFWDRWMPKIGSFFIIKIYFWLIPNFGVPKLSSNILQFNCTIYLYA